MCVCVCVCACVLTTYMSACVSINMCVYDCIHTYVGVCAVYRYMHVYLYVHICYGLNVFPSLPNSYITTLVPNVIVSGGGVFAR